MNGNQENQILNLVLDVRRGWILNMVVKMNNINIKVIFLATISIIILNIGFLLWFTENGWLEWLGFVFGPVFVGFFVGYTFTELFGEVNDS